MMDYRHAARLAPMLAAMYGHKRTIGGYKYGQVLLEIKADIDSGRLQDYTQQEYGKIMEAKARGRRKTK